ncbi:MAG: hypothetical protein AB4040_01395 [Synechococcus sp.]
MRSQYCSKHPPSPRSSDLDRGVTLDALRFWYLSAEFMGRELNYLLEINSIVSHFLQGSDLRPEERSDMKSLIDEALKRWLQCARSLDRPEHHIQEILQLKRASANSDFSRLNKEAFISLKRDISDEFSKYAGKRLNSRSAQRKVCKKRHINL